MNPYTPTKRQRQMIEVIANGGSVKDFANKYNVSVATAEVTKYNLYKQIGIHNNVLLTHYAISAGIVKLKSESEVRAYD